MTEKDWDKLLRIKTSGRDDSNSDQYRCRCIGVEYDERIYEAAVQKKASSVSESRTSFIHTRAEEYEVPVSADRFYFFNPFSVEILKKVPARIRESYDGREMLLFFYYPSDEYVAWLMTVDEMTWMR